MLLAEKIILVILSDTAFSGLTLAMIIGLLVMPSVTLDSPVLMLNNAPLCCAAMSWEKLTPCTLVDAVTAVGLTLITFAAGSIGLVSLSPLGRVLLKVKVAGAIEAASSIIPCDSPFDS